MKSYPKITIVTPCFNREQYIRETIESVLGQNYPNLEYIVIDDGSTDGSWDIIQEYKDRLSYCEKLEGYRESPVHAINYGFSKGSGEIFGWLNDKNVLFSKSLFVIADIFERQDEVDWLTGLAATLDERGYVTRVSAPRKHRYDFLIGKWEIVQQESTFWRSSLWHQVGGLQEEDIWAFDVGLWAEFFQVGAKLWHIQTVLGAYRRITRGQSIARKSEFEAYRKKALQRLHKDTSVFETVAAAIYRTLYYSRPVWRMLPDAMFSAGPLKRFGHPALMFEPGEGVWHQTMKNPFRGAGF